MSGPSRKVKLAYVAKDPSEHFIETWPVLIYMVLAAVAVGIVAWSMTTVLCMLLHLSVWGLKGLSGWLLFLVVVLGGGMRLYLIEVCQWDTYGDGASASMQNFYDTYQDSDTEGRYQRETWQASLRRFVMTFLTLGFGGSGGLEGPGIPLGEGLGAFAGQCLGVIETRQLRALQVAAIAAVMDTLLGCPLTSVVFAVEIVFAGRFLYRMLVFGLVGALSAHVMTQHYFHLPVWRSVGEHALRYEWYEYLQVALVALLLGSLVRGALVGLRQCCEAWVSAWPAWQRVMGMSVLLAGVLLLGLAMGLSADALLGTGESYLMVIFAKPCAIDWQMLLGIFLVKVVLIVLTLLAGGSAGVLVPAVFLGIVSGLLAHHVMGYWGLLMGVVPDVYMVTGMVSALVMVADIPLTSMIFAVELFGAHYAVPAILTVCIAHSVVDQWQRHLLEGKVK